MSNSYVATPSAVNPAAVYGLYPSWLLNPIGSDYAAQYGYTSTNQIAQVIQETIIDSIPKQWSALKVFLGKDAKYKGNKEYTWVEKLWQRPVLYAAAGTGAAASQTITLTSGGSGHIVINDLITYPNNNQGIVTAVSTTANTMTVACLNGAPNLPAVSTNDRFTITAAPISDGHNSFIHYDRSTTVEYTNWMLRGQRNKKWDTVTAQIWKNQGITDYFEKDAADLMQECYRDMFIVYMNGTKGEMDITVPAGTGLTAGTFKARMGDGVFPFMQKYGAMHATSSPATLEADFKTLAFATNYESVGATRIVMGTDRVLHMLSTIWKDPVRYAPNDTIASLDLSEYKFGTMRFVPVVVPQFELGTGMFPEAFSKRLIVLNPDTIYPTGLQGFQTITAGHTGDQLKGNGGYNDYIDYWCEYWVGLQMTTVGSSFYIDMTTI